MESSAPVTPQRLMELGFGYAPPLIIQAAVENKVFDSLANGAKSLEEISRETGASQRGLRALMNALVGLQLLQKQADKYGLTPESEAFLISGKSGSLAPFYSFNPRNVLPHWLKLPEIVRSGKPAAARNEESVGTEFFRQLVATIIPMSFGSANALANHLQISGARDEVRVLDVAAGSAIWGILLAQKSPRVRVTAVDFEGVIPVTRQVVEEFGLSGRFDFIGGDIATVDFGSGYDIATLGHILHSEGAERAQHLLNKVGAALKSGGTIAIGEWLVNDERTEPIGPLLFAVNMLVSTERGDTFSFNEIKTWLEAAGFKDARTLEAPGPSPLVLATKR